MRVRGALLLSVLGPALCLVGGCGTGDLSLPNDGAPATLTAVSGDGQEAKVGSTLPDPLVARVSDAVQRPVPGVWLVFRFQNQVPGAEIDPPAVQTDSSGRALVRVRLGTTSGPQTIEALIDEENAPDTRALFTVTAIQPGTDGSGGGDHPKKGTGRNAGEESDNGG
jgi:ABC-type phosphate transport system substrate-binding protein